MIFKESLGYFCQHSYYFGLFGLLCHITRLRPDLWDLKNRWKFNLPDFLLKKSFIALVTGLKKLNRQGSLLTLKDWKKNVGIKLFSPIFLTGAFSSFFSSIHVQIEFSVEWTWWINLLWALSHFLHLNWPITLKTTSNLKAYQTRNQSYKEFFSVNLRWFALKKYLWDWLQEPWS